MKLLALDSSGMVASVAVLADDVVLAEYSVNYKKTHSQTLLPMLDTVASMIELDLNSVDAIALAAGPGSFTGLRIGSATAKGLGQALDKPLISVPTLDALAMNVYNTEKLICPIMDARRNQVYTGIYQWKDGQLTAVKEQDALAITELIDILNAFEQEVIFLGDGVPVYRKIIEEKMTCSVSFAPASCNRQRAACVGVLAQQYYKEGKLETAAEHKPEYLRQSQAERERAEKQQKGEL